MKIGDHDTPRLNIFFHSLSKMWRTLTIIDYNPIILCKMAMTILCNVIWDPLHHAECGSKTNVKATLCIPNFATTCYSHQNCRLHTCMCTLKHLKTLGLTELPPLVSVSFWHCQRNLIKTLQNEAITPLITKITLNGFLNIFRRSY